MRDTSWTKVVSREEEGGDFRLGDGSRVAVLGGGPAGSFFGCFLLEFAQRVGIDLEVDLYEAKDFSRPAPHGCNMCGGIVSESLVQTLAAEGVELPGNVVQRGIDSYVLHMDEGSVRIQTPLFEKRIGAVHRGSGPRDIVDPKWDSFDGHLLKLAIDKGVKLTRARIVEVGRDNGRPQLKTREGQIGTYDLLAVATGVNAASKKLFEGEGFDYEFPGTTRTYIQERLLGQDTVSRVLGSSMHVFLLDIPRLDFGAIIPKGDYVTICLLGEGIDEALAREFLESPAVKACLPTDAQASGRSCNCFPRINVRGTAQPFFDRVVFIGDCAVTKLFKDGIGAAYRTAKAAARTAVFRGVSADSFRKHYSPLCKKITRDNMIGKATFAVAGKAQRRGFLRRTILRMAATEQQGKGRRPHISTVLWDMFTGSASYGEIVLRSMRPGFVLGLLWHLGCCILRPREGCIERRTIDG